ncbi:ATP-binding protein [Ramlibacter albus]|uniref:ATP-binding protein n=1 Tax=Ramlibacter albus TaxID=2079448 RepID=A0A923S545_9BURK|nr:ATP-binding protein [Ramlibacter albus]MBC5768185.1 ATP-binding protein [Ramlibacter albus]
MHIERTSLLGSIQQRLRTFRAVELVGPRQVGKTTLARAFLAPDSPNYFDLENPLMRSRLESAPMEVLQNLEGLVVVDEIQHLPRLTELLRYLIDRPTHIDRPGQYLLLGSASPRAMHPTESLLGRVSLLEIGGFTIDEIGVDSEAVNRLWLRGGFPNSYLAESDETSWTWRSDAINRYIYTDLPQLGVNVPAPMMTRFWQFLAHYHGQTWNGAELARSLGVGEMTVRRYLDHLTQTFMIRQLPPWHENLGKRQVKAPKIYFRDSGLLHFLLDVRTFPQLLTHGRVGASWEGFAIEQVLRLAQPHQAYFWATHAGAELDLLLVQGDRRIGVEIKYTDQPRVTASMQIAMEDLKLERLYVVYPGLHRFALAQKIEAVPLWALLPARA